MGTSVIGRVLVVGVLWGGIGVVGMGQAGAEGDSCGAQVVDWEGGGQGASYTGVLERPGVHAGDVAHPDDRLGVTVTVEGGKATVVTQPATRFGVTMRDVDVKRYWDNSFGFWAAQTIDAVHITLSDTGVLEGPQCGSGTTVNSAALSLYSETSWPVGAQQTDAWHGTVSRDRPTL